jgi:hypothetical protein
MQVVLVIAGIYNLLWGAVVILLPGWTLSHLGVDPGSGAAITQAIWQCVGMIVGVYGIGYLAAARDPARHWPIVLVGLLGKSMGWTILTNDLAWWIPFALMLRLAWRRRPGAPAP